MGPWMLPLIGMGVGLAKSELVDRPKEERQRKVEATKARWSPWTGMQPGQVQEADPFGSAMQGGMALAGLSQSMQQADAQNKMLDAQKNWFNSQTAPSSFATPNMSSGGGPNLGLQFNSATAGMSGSLDPAMGAGGGYYQTPYADKLAQAYARANNQALAY